MFTRHIIKAVLINKRGEMLMLRRSKTDVRRPLEWDLPGGFRDAGESIEDCLKREIAEEAGIGVTGQQLVFAKTEIREWIDNKKNNQIENVVFLFFLGNASQSEVTLSLEHSESKWLPVRQAIKEYTYPLHCQLLQYLLDNELLPA